MNASRVTLVSLVAVSLFISAPAWSQSQSKPAPAPSKPAAPAESKPAAPAAQDKSDHPLIEKAIAQLSQLITDLETRGSERVGGHRLKAIESLKEAQKELRQALAYSGARQSVAAGELNINTATADQMRALPGINEAEAKKIVAGRPYAAVDDLLKKKVVSQETYDKIKDKVVVKSK